MGWAGRRTCDEGNSIVKLLSDLRTSHNMPAAGAPRTCMAHARGVCAEPAVRWKKAKCTGSGPRSPNLARNAVQVETLAKHAPMCTSMPYRRGLLP